MSDKKASPTKVITEPCRGSYVYIIAPSQDDNGEDYFGAQVLIPKKDKVTLNKMKLAIKAAAVKKFGPDAKLGQLKLPLRDADAEEREGAEYKGCYFLNCKATKRPGVVRSVQGEIEPIAGEEMFEFVYSGAFYRFSLNFYGFVNKGNKGVAVGLKNMMFNKHGDRLDGSTTAEDDFSEFGSEGGGSDDFDDDDMFGDD